MSPEMGDALPIVLLVAFVALLAAPILWLVFKAFRTHDPARALASTEVGRDGTFELAWNGGGVAFFRFEIATDTDSDYDLVVRGCVSEGGREQAFAWRTADRTLVDGAGDATRVVTTHAVSSSCGSFELASLPRGRCVVRGKVEQGTLGLLVRAWVYVPAR